MYKWYALAQGDKGQAQTTHACHAISTNVRTNTHHHLHTTHMISTAQPDIVLQMMLLWCQPVPKQYVSGIPNDARSGHNALSQFDSRNVVSCPLCCATTP